LDAAFNTFFYRKIEIVPWNIVKYNVLSKSGGPNLYGTEPWTYYFRNLALNYNIWFALSLVSFPVFILHKLLSRSQHGFQSGLRTIVFLSPFYMWLAIFTLQPHKEERFMYPAYPFLALSAAIALHIILVAFGNPDPKTLIGRIPARLKLSVVAAGLLTAFILGGLRIIGITTAYSAPLSLYTPLGAGQASEVGTVGGAGDFVCYGKEWYRFPTSYFLPRGMHAKWVRSEFRGLLPGEFSEARTGFGIWSGTWLPPLGMNDMNEEDPGKYVDLRACQFLVDTQYPEQQRAAEVEGGKWMPPPNEPDYVADEATWEVVKCERFLDAASTSFLARTLWIPDLPYVQVPETFRRKWGRHCLLRRR
jgi:alpha-1,2-mannosyltransferase